MTAAMSVISGEAQHHPRVALQAYSDKAAPPNPSTVNALVRAKLGS